MNDMQRKVVQNMSMQLGQQQQVLYQADRDTVESIRSMRNRLHNVCRRHLNQFVRVQTFDGETIIGRIVQCERGMIHLAVPGFGGGGFGGGFGGQRQPYGYPFGTPYSPFGSPVYNDVILPLVLYELLAITLLYT